MGATMELRVPAGNRDEVETFLDEERYLPTYLQDEDGSCVLFVRRFLVRRGPKGRVWCRVQNTAHEYRDIALMLEDIAAKRMTELPAEADGNPDFVPADIRELIVNAKKLRS